MRIIAPREPGVASLPRRTAAALIDALLMLTALGATAAAAFAALARLGRPPAWLDSATSPDLSWLERWELPLRIMAPALAPIGRNWRTPGMRLAGIRRADARTRGPVRMHSAMVESAADSVVATASRALRRSGSEAYEARRRAANDEIEQLRASDPDADPWELLECSRQILRRERVGCGPLARRAIAPLVAVTLPAVWSSRRQTPTQRLAGIIVVDDR